MLALARRIVSGEEHADSVESVFAQVQQVAADAEALLVDAGWAAPEPAAAEAVAVEAFEGRDDAVEPQRTLFSWAGDHPAPEEGGHGPAAQAHVHRAAHAGRRYRVARATHGDARLAVGLRLQRDRGVEGFGGEGPQRRPLCLRHPADGGEPAGDVAGVV